uniref:(northern house mosquito) hypothetical protein n=1 Tax=Culex pipiens TaxID=7175 RepID=A0A8D8BEQ4_CULPI
MSDNGRYALHGVQPVRAQNASPVGTECQRVRRHQEVSGDAEHQSAKSTVDRRHGGRSSPALSHRTGAWRVEGGHREEKMGSGFRRYVLPEVGPRSRLQAGRHLL